MVGGVKVSASNLEAANVPRLEMDEHMKLACSPHKRRIQDILSAEYAQIDGKRATDSERTVGNG
jgi:hypothetical protein